MQHRSIWSAAAGLAVGCAMMVLGGCGAEPAAAPAAAPATAPASAPAPAPAPATGTGTMSEMHHDAATSPAATNVSAAPTKAYMCEHCGMVEEKAGDCPMCHTALKEVAISNPDPKICPVTGETIEKPHLVVADGKVYDCCDTDCCDEMKKDPAKCVAAAKARMDAPKTEAPATAPEAPKANP